MGTLGCLIFSPLLNFKMPGVPTGGILGKKFTPQIFLNYDVILRWSTTYEISRVRFRDLAVSPQPLIVGRQNLCQNAQNSRFPMPDLEKTFVYLLHKKSYTEKTKFAPIFIVLVHSSGKIFCFFPLYCVAKPTSCLKLRLFYKFVQKKNRFQLFSHGFEK